MRKKLVVGASLIALVLSVSLFAISVFAAVGQTFGVNNTIKFLGSPESLAFDLNAVVTGTTKDGDASLAHSWSYDYEKDSVTSQIWNVPGNLVFFEEDKELGGAKGNRVEIVYTFNITNKSKNEQRIKVYIDELTIDTSVLTADVTGAVGSEVLIASGQTGIVSVALVPTVRFTISKTCDFNLKIELV